MKHEEDTLQMQCVAWFEMQYKAALIHHSPNGGKRNIKVNRFGQKYCPEGSRFKKMGQKSGFPDLIIIGAGKIFFVELKSKKGVLNDNQKEINKRIMSLGHRVYTCRTIEEFILIVTKELNQD